MSPRVENRGGKPGQQALGPTKDTSSPHKRRAPGMDCREDKEQKKARQSKTGGRPRRRAGRRSRPRRRGSRWTRRRPGARRHPQSSGECPRRGTRRWPRGAAGGHAGPEGGGGRKRRRDGRRQVRKQGGRTERGGKHGKSRTTGSAICPRVESGNHIHTHEQKNNKTTKSHAFIPSHQTLGRK